MVIARGLFVCQKVAHRWMLFEISHRHLESYVLGHLPMLPER